MWTIGYSVTPLNKYTFEHVWKFRIPYDLQFDLK